MEIEIYKNPCLLLEAAELVYAFVNNIPAERLTMPGGQCIPADVVSAIQEAACVGLSPEDSRLQFYFRGVPLEGGAGRLSCLGCCLLYSCSVEVSCSGVDDMVEALQASWARQRREHYRINGINPIALNIDLVEGEDFRSIASEIAQLSAPPEYKMQLVEVFSDFDYHVAQVGELLRPVVEALKPMLAPWVVRASPLMAQWEHYFQCNGAEKFLLERAGVKVDEVNKLRMALRYFSPSPAPVYLDEKTGCVSFHIGVSVQPELDAAEAPTMKEEEYTALRLLASPDRVAMLRLMMDGPMSIPELSRRLHLNSGSVFRDVNSMCNMGLLLFQPENGKNLYCTDLSAISKITEHLVESIRGGGEGL